jgi:hypothetical protein
LECKAGYAYAGADELEPRAGIRATIRMSPPPVVTTGHVGGWVGVGGPTAGPDGVAEWIQAGFSGFDTGQEEMYYEITVAGKTPTYHTIKQDLKPSESHLVSVLEVSNAPGSWRVWVDDRAVSPVTRLPGSHAKFVPQAIGEDWAATRGCNRFGYSFKHVEIATAPGGSWSTAAAGYVFRDPRHIATKTGPGSFIARSLSTAKTRASGGPPMLGSIATYLAGRPLNAACANQPTAVRNSPIGHLVLTEHVCEILDGYAVADPWVPRAQSDAGFEVASTGLSFLREVERAGHVPATRIDCRAVEQFYDAFRELGATPDQAIALRAELLRRRVQVVPELSLPADCPIH